jgi:signal transduction histidine kinase
LELGKIDFKIEKLDLKNIADEVVKESGVLASDKNIAIELVLPKQALPNVLGDGDRVKQVLFNVVGNALKFCKKGKIVVGVEVGEAEVQVNITDSGEGIAKEVQGLLFHKFQQAGTSLYTRDTSRGTGLGLYISRLMMEGMGGKIWLKASEVGVGSTFTFSLPIAKDLEK